MGKIAFLTKRGGMYWFRRRPPLINAMLSPVGVNAVEACPKAARGHLALSLRTRCPLEARRRAARICALFEFGWQIYETAMNQMIHPDAGADLQQEFARGLLDVLRKNVAIAERLAGQVMPEPARAAMIDQNDAASRREIVAAAPQAAKVAAPTQKANSLDDPEFEAALMELADREGWWHDNPDEVVEQFDWMIVGLLTVQEEYVKYCARKGLDPATALPSLARLAGSFEAVAEAVGEKQPEVERERLAATAKPARRPAALDPTPVSELAARYLDLRCQGYPLQRKTETPDEKSGKSFRANSRRNIEATVGLFIDICGDIPVADIQSHHCADFVALLARIPGTHGKSSKKRLSVREAIETADRTEQAEIDKLAIRLRRDGRSPGEIEDALLAARIERLRTATCVRHMRDFSRILNFAVFDGVRAENPMKEHLWTPREEINRRHREKTVQRTGWGDHINALLCSPIYREPLDEPGEPLFWAPLLAMFAGLRLEEALQLRVEDFDTEGGIPYLHVRNTTGDALLKSAGSQRRVPLHDGLVCLGLLELVSERRAAGHGRIFPFLERGKSKGKLGEIYSKRFTTYRKKHALYSPARDFQSLRTEFQTRLTLARVPAHSRIALMGHVVSDVTHEHYFRVGDRIETLKEYVDLIDINVSDVRSPYPGRDMEPSHGPGLVR